MSKIYPKFTFKSLGPLHICKNVPLPTNPVSPSDVLIFQISYMEADMEEDRPNILCTKVDQHAGDWPSTSFLQLFRIAKLLVEPKYTKRPEIKDVSQDNTSSCASYQ